MLIVGLAGCLADCLAGVQETLRKADETFGPENKDLYIAFDGLLSRHLPT